MRRRRWRKEQFLSLLPFLLFSSLILLYPSLLLNLQENISWPWLGREADEKEEKKHAKRRKIRITIYWRNRRERAVNLSLDTNSQPDTGGEGGWGRKIEGEVEAGYFASQNLDPHHHLHCKKVRWTYLYGSQEQNLTYFFKKMMMGHKRNSREREKIILLAH